MKQVWGNRMLKQPGGEDFLEEGEQYIALPSGILAPADSFANAGPIGVDLFCGCGGFSCGFMQAGWRVMAACDNDPLAAITYLTNLATYPCELHFISPADRDRLEAALQKTEGRGRHTSRHDIIEFPVCGSGWISSEPRMLGVPHFFFGDIRKLTGQTILDALELEKGEVDCVFGGPPCQGFSTAGKRDVLDPRNTLVFEFIRLVLELMPRTMVMENVPNIVQMTTPDGLPIVDLLCRILEDGNFGAADALSRSIRSSAGCGAAIRGAKNIKRVRDEDVPRLTRDDAGEPAQQELFG